MSIILIVICFIVGLLIGAIGIGGVLLVPALTLFSDLSVHQAVPICTLSYLATGTVGVIVYARHGSIPWSGVGWLCIGAIPGALLGSLSLLGIPAAILMLLIAALMVVSGIDALVKAYRKLATNPDTRQWPPLQYILIGAVTGFGSAITGTGGPLILVPIAIYLGLPVLTAIGLSQAIQLPIATFASIGNWLEGNLQFELVWAIAGMLVLGSFCGALLIHRFPAEPLRKLIAGMLVFLGIAIGVRQLAALPFVA